MAGFELRAASLSLALAALSCYASRPQGPAESALPLSDFERGCDQGSPAACDWAGARRLAHNDPIGAEVMFRRGCAGGDAHACLRLYTQAREASALTDDARARALALACASGLVEACELLADRGAASAREEDKQSALGAMVDGCSVAADQASCVRLALAYDSGALGGTPVLSRRDPARAMPLYERACPPRFATANVGDAHASPRHAEEARALVALACERAAAHHLAGDGVQKDLLIGLQFLRRCTTDACRARRAELRGNSALAAADDREDQEEIAAHGSAGATAGTLTASAPEPSPPQAETGEHERGDQTGDDGGGNQQRPTD